MSDTTDDMEQYADLVATQYERNQMATVTTSKPATPAPAAPAIVAAAASVSVKLPTKPRQSVHDANRLRLLVTGEPGVGKTLLGLQEPTCLNLTFDPLRESYGGFQEYVPSWEHFKGYVKLLVRAHAVGKLPYKRVQIDGADIGFRLCQQSVCKAAGVTHPSKGDYGSVWDALNDEFALVIAQLFSLLPTGVWFTCHAKEKEIEKANGRKVQRLSPTLKGSSDDLIVGKCDMVMNIAYVGNQMLRVGTIRGDESVSAKCDIKDRFLTPDGRQVQEIVLGNKGEAEAYRRFLVAYENKQPYATYQEALEKSGRAKPKVEEKEEVIEEAE